MKPNTFCFHRPALDNLETLLSPRLRGACMDIFRILCLQARYEDGNHNGIFMRRGQVLTGRKTLAQRTSRTEKTIRNALVELARKRQLSVCEGAKRGANDLFLYTIDSYEVMDGSENEGAKQGAKDGPRMGQGWASKEEREEIKEVKDTSKEKTPEPGSYQAFVRESAALYLDIAGNASKAPIGLLGKWRKEYGQELVLWVLKDLSLKDSHPEGNVSAYIATVLKNTPADVCTSPPIYRGANGNGKQSFSDTLQLLKRFGENHALNVLPAGYHRQDQGLLPPATPADR